MLTGKQTILIIISVVLLTFALYTPAFAWLENTFFIPHAIVTTDINPPLIYQTMFCYPGIRDAYVFSTDPTTPAIVPSNATGPLYVLASDLPKNGSGIATVTAKGYGITGELTFARSTDWSIPPAGFEECDYSLWKSTSPFTTPSTGQFGIDVTVTDNAGNPITKTFYAGATEVSGDWFINDQQITTQTTLYLNTKTVIIKFNVTSGAWALDKVYLQIFDKNWIEILWKELEYIPQEKIWKASHVLPEEGTYVVRGILYVQGRERLSLTITVETSAPPPPPPTGILRYIFGIAGFICLAYASYDIYATKEKGK